MYHEFHRNLKTCLLVRKRSSCYVETGLCMSSVLIAGVFLTLVIIVGTPKFIQHNRVEFHMLCAAIS